MKLIDTINMCSHLQRKLFDAGGEYRALRSASVICYPFVPDHLDANRPSLRCRWSAHEAPPRSAHPSI